MKAQQKQAMENPKASKENIDFGLLPLKLSDLQNNMIEVISCTQISGGKNYENEMPKTLTLQRTNLLTNEQHTAVYVQATE